MNIALILSYDGTAYHGWQIQKNGPSIQETLETAIGRLLGQSVRVSGVGRTDAGVHARWYVANFKADCTIPLDRLPLALNSFLPNDIAVSGACEVPDGFDARFDCTRKEYAYYLFPSALPDPFLAGRAYRYTYPLDLARMQAGAQKFVGRQDFAAVRSQGTPVKSTVRTVFWCEAEAVGPLIRIRVCGDGFLYNMVRAIAGTLTYVGGGKLAPDDVSDILRAGDREAAGPTLPAHGLYMNRLWYEQTPELAPFALDRAETGFFL
ncbi:tRNA pseudouridine(38-40) synthase TruA [Agathobaculum sp.]|uniref:tRNA pseudouridine(38-40) synthase TruA n=1 Tax=Agathobaculum sp. TaxID=2048138 RepID=UPI002A8235B4|nr:tRNA pseudouridine(38-40) synthase TruA [Agathobaculum sp.]MDY3617651.1 tRNA pseudouridine(38-40) synthase TruA [Agathobaculum sp.]